MRCWRITRDNEFALDRTAKKSAENGGRWNPKGTPILYAGSTRALSALEYFCYLPPRLVPHDLVFVEVEVDDTVPAEIYPPSALPPGWDAPGRPQAAADFGSEWATTPGRSLVMMVPSVIIKDEFNVLVNPRHPEASKFTINAPRPFHYDARMFK